MGGDGEELAWTPAPGTPGGSGGAAAKGPRWTTSLRAVVLLLAIAVAVVAVLWLQQVGVSGAAEQLASQEAPKLGVPPLSAGTAPPGTTAVTSSPVSEVPLPAPGQSGAGVVVHVVGAVQHPGVVSLPAGSRVLAAITAAGGALPSAQLQALNLAALVQDGAQILVPTQEQVDAGIPSGLGASGSSSVGAAETGEDPGRKGGSGGLINLNTATAAQLDVLPGVGPVLAERIVQWRKDHGPFKAAEELDAVPGIGAKMLATLRPLVVAP
ncbi:ComEA family DNA-binding protein [Arthrobacter sp. GMC3]|uniref:ComEA family DNA-binding protein n=1 Tax=Arthrobacter sp. GMC3 TaxID=2058894 RepID=UPI000CE36E05|nr:ComEA family DNA-binding protein [Arthrobacter sp. GMC3]